MSVKASRFALACGAAVLILLGTTIHWAAQSWTVVNPFGGTSVRSPTAESNGSSLSLEPLSDPKVHGASVGWEQSPGSVPVSPTALLSGDRPFAAALLAASSTYGIHDYRVRRALMYVRGLCASPDPSGSLALPMPDPSRDWVFESIAELCVGIESLEVNESLPRIGEPESLFSIDRSRGRDAAVAAAESLLAHESDPVLVEEAALFAWEAGRSPSPASMGVNPASLGPVEHMAAISDAVKLSACHELSGCGSTNWQTLALCVRVGCAPGSTLHQALRAHHSEQRMRLIEGYARWIQSFRGG